MAVKTRVYDREEYHAAYRLVGEFMHEWSLLEHQINKGLQKLLGLPGMEGTIVTANMQVRDKIQALKTLLHLFSVGDDEAAALNLMTRIANMSGDRNVVAHNMFWPHKDGGVEFSLTKAKGVLQFPNGVWGAKQFAEKRVRMAVLARDLKSAVAAATGVRERWLRSQLSKSGSVPNLFSNAITGHLTPSPELGGQGLLSGLSLTPQETDSSLSTTHETGNQPPPSPPAKPKARKRK